MARIPYTTNSTFVTFIGVKPQKFGAIYIPGRSDPCHPSLRSIPELIFNHPDISLAALKTITTRFTLE